jgi:hypothetical protein
VVTFTNDSLFLIFSTDYENLLYKKDTNLKVWGGNAHFIGFHKR